MSKPITIRLNNEYEEKIKFIKKYYEQITSTHDIYWSPSTSGIIKQSINCLYDKVIQDKWNSDQPF